MKYTLRIDIVGVSRDFDDAERLEKPREERWHGCAVIQIDNSHSDPTRFFDQ